MTKLSNIDIAYEYLKKKKDRASFLELWAEIEKNTSQEDVDKRMLMASLYTALVCDNRFSLTPENDWGLSDQIKDNDLKKKLGNNTTLDDRDEINESIDLSDDGLITTFDDSTEGNPSFFDSTENENYETYVHEDDTFEKGHSF